MAENALAPEQKLPKAPPELPDDEVLYELADLFRVFGDSTRITFWPRNRCVSTAEKWRSPW